MVSQFESLFRRALLKIPENFTGPKTVFGTFEKKRTPIFQAFLTAAYAAQECDDLIHSFVFTSLNVFLC